MSLFENLSPQDIAEMKARLSQMEASNQAMGIGLNITHHLTPAASGGFLLGNIIGNRINGWLNDKRAKKAKNNEDTYEDFLKSQQLLNNLSTRQNINFNLPEIGNYNAENLGNWTKNNLFTIPNNQVPQSQNLPNNQYIFNNIPNTITPPLSRGCW